MLESAHELRDSDRQLPQSAVAMAQMSELLVSLLHLAQMYVSYWVCEVL